MKNQNHYFDKIIKVLKELKKDNPDVELSKHLSLATSEYDSIFSLSDKELFTVLQKHQSELSMNTLSTKDLEKIISDTENFFKEDFEDTGLEDEEDF